MMINEIESSKLSTAVRDEKEVSFLKGLRMKNYLTIVLWFISDTFEAQHIKGFVYVWKFHACTRALGAAFCCRRVNESQNSVEIIYD